MSHIARELKMLFYLNRRRDRYVQIEELADLLEVTPRQIRRYREDLVQCDFDITSRTGEGGGYKLRTSLSRNLMIPDNIMLALNIASKNNTSLFKELNSLPVVSKMEKVVYNSNDITDDELEKMVDIVNAINNHKMISFDYEGIDKKITVEPYKVLYTNHTYYLRAVNYLNELRTYDVDKIINIQEFEDYIIDMDIVRKTDEEMMLYGIKDGEITEVVLRYDNDSDIKMINRVFEYKGVIDTNKKTYTVKSRSMNELFYPLFSLGKKIKIETEEVKNEYINYLNKQLKALK